MSAERSIGELAAETLARAERLRWVHDAMQFLPEAAQRKTLVMDLRAIGRIDDADTQLLIEAYQLETA